MQRYVDTAYGRIISFAFNIGASFVFCSDYTAVAQTGRSTQKLEKSRTCV